MHVRVIPLVPTALRVLIPNWSPYVSDAAARRSANATQTDLSRLFLYLSPREKARRSRRRELRTPGGDRRRGTSGMAARPEDVDIAASAARGSFPPEDRRGFVYRACFFLGAGILFPWNSYITAVDYFERVHPGNSTCSRTELGDERAFT